MILIRSYYFISGASSQRLSLSLVTNIMGGPGINDKFPNLRGSTQDTDNFDLYEYLCDSWGLVFMHVSENDNERYIILRR